MGIEALKQKLANGEITKEQFDQELKQLLDNQSISQEEYDNAINGTNQGDNGGQGGQQQGISLDEVKKLIQSETDKVRTEYSQKLKDRDSELDKLRKEKMTDEERADHERKEFEKKLKDRETELVKREVALHTVDQLREKQLPLEFRDILAGSNVDDTNERIKSFSEQWQKALNDAVNARFKEKGSDPDKGKGLDKNIANPWKAGQINLTKQAEIMKSDPDLAKKLMGEA